MGFVPGFFRGISMVCMSPRVAGIGCKTFHAYVFAGIGLDRSAIDLVESNMDRVGASVAR